MKNILKIYLMVVIGLFFVACDSSTSDDSSSSAKEIIVTHNGGVDFSENSTNIEWEQQDGYAVTWSPGAYVDGEEYGKGIWYSNNVYDANYIYIQDAGAISLDDVSSIDESKWPATTSAIAALKVNHVYIVKTRDGYAKFKVSAVDFTSEDWNFTATYVYSLTTSFSAGSTSSSSSSSSTPSTSQPGEQQPTSSKTNDLNIGHLGGIDFSADNNNSAWEQQDGYAVIWSPSYAYIQGEENGKGLWYNNNVTDTQYIYIQTAGEVDLANVTGVNESAWYNKEDAIPALQVGHVYVVKTRDGYAKFKVNAIDYLSSGNWNFDATYEYSTTTSFQ